MLVASSQQGTFFPLLFFLLCLGRPSARGALKLVEVPLKRQHLVWIPSPASFGCGPLRTPTSNRSEKKSLRVKSFLTTLALFDRGCAAHEWQGSNWITIGAKLSLIPDLQGHYRRP
ncbi:hypothetical protein GGI35DRAFT_453026 [Trichoderma velutinum]